jgi:NADPH:quinone reductase-like Zn-dependent oxidoreductase
VALFPLNGRGAHAELGVAPVAAVARLPETLSFEKGATLPLAALTGRPAVDALKVKRGARVLVSGALGAVGRVAVQYLKELGAVPVAGVRASRLKEARALAGEALDLAKPSPAFDYAVSAAAPAAADLIRHMRDGGTVAAVVRAPPDANPDGRVNVIQVMARDDAATLQKVVDAAARGEIQIPIAHRHPLHELDKAHHAMHAAPSGKVVLVH